jgi:PAS domain S-box-containing protein
MKKDNKSDAVNLRKKAEALSKKKTTRSTTQLSEGFMPKLKEEQLEISEERFRSLSENARVGLYRTTPDGTILLANSALIAMLGYSSFDELAQRNLEQEGFETPHQRKAFLETIEQNGEVKNFESTWMRQDRTPFYVQESALAIRDTNGKTLFYDGTVEDITERKCAEDKLRINVKRLQELNVLQSRLQSPTSIEEKLKLITDAVVRIFDADFARIWMIKPGDRCEDGCIHAQATEKEHICRFRDRCLHLMASSGRYTHTNGQVHARVPFGCYKIGKIAAADEPKFLTNEVTTDPRVHNNAWAKELGLVSFAGYRLGDNTVQPLGVLALFSKQAISSEDDSFLELIAHSTSWVMHSEREEAVLRESEERYRNLVESIPDWIWEMDTQGNYTYASSAVRNILGYEPEDMIGRSPSDFMPEVERQQMGVIIKEFIAKRQPIVAIENVNLHRDGRLIVLETNGNPIFGDNGELKGYRGIDRDITVRKRTEDALAWERYLMNALMSNLPDYIYFKDKESRFLKISDALAKSFGLSVPEEAIGKTDFDFFSEEHARQVYNDEQEIIRSGKPLVKEEKETWPDRTDTWCSTTKLPLVNKDGEIVGTFGISMDITERKKSEIALRESEEKFKNVFNTSTDSISISQIEDGMFLSINSGFTRILGYTEEDILGKTSIAIDFWPNLSDRNKLIQGLQENGIIENLIAQFRTKSGELLYGMMSASIIELNGIKHILCITRDITERKFIEDSLHESEERYRMLAENSNDVIWKISLDGKYVYISPSVYQLLGYTVDEVMNWTMEQIASPDSIMANQANFAKSVLEYYQQDQVLESGYLEIEQSCKDGSTVWTESSAKLVFNEAGEPIEYIGVSRNITERKKIEETLKESERLLRESQEVAGLGSFAWDLTKWLWTSSSILDRIFGIDESYVRSFDGWLATIHPDFRQMVQNYNTDYFLGKKQKFDEEYKIINQKNGQERWVHGLGKLEFDSNYQPIKFLGTIQDITERKLSEETINNGRSKLSLALKIAHLGAWEYDVANDIFTFNDSFYAIFRTTADQVGGNTMSATDYANRFVHPEDLAIVGDEIRMSIETENPDYCRQLEHRIKFADGGIGSVAVRFVIVKDESGRTIKMFGINQDITERKKAENEILINSKRLKAIVEILQYPSHSIQDYLDFALNKAIEMTDSKIGFIFFYSEEKKEFILNSWSKEVMNECAIAEKQTVWQLENAGLWGEAVRQRKPIVINDYQLPNPLKKGCPEGHAPLHKFLITPMFENDKIVGVVAVGNKETDYLDADVMQLTVLMDIVWKALDKKKSDDALRESEEKLNTLFASMTEMVTTHKLVFNKNGEPVNYQITDCNDAFTTITGIKKEDVIGKLATEVYQTDIPPHLEEFTRVAITGESYEFTEYYNDIDKYLMVSVISPTKNQFSTIVTDITVIQQIQDDIKDKNKELENYLYVASHDLRSPLVNIQGFSQRFLKQSDAIKNTLEKCQIETETKKDLDKITNEDIPKTLNFILSNVTKMENLINGLLQISRTGRVVMTIKKVDMNRLIKTIIAANDFQITELSAKVIIDDLADCYGDENLLNQLFSNIISNALKYRDSSRQLVIEISCQAQFNKFIYSIKDSGIGIEPRHLEKIWDVFYRVDPGSDIAGEGIGLSLSRRITDKHRGKIWVESEVGKGSVFHVELQRNEFLE